jgi:hypothetical protein
VTATPTNDAQKSKKKRSGCFMFLAFLGVGVILVGALATFVAWRHGWLEKLWRGGTLVYEGMNAPGMKEVRALGCAQAMKMNADDVGRLIGKDGPHDVQDVVVCVAKGDKPPSCNDVAEVYVKALGGSAAGPFAVSVRHDSDGKHCTERYASDGTHQWE